MSNIFSLEQKMVNFNGVELLGIKANDGKIYAGVSYICNGIGLTKSQKDTQVQKIQSDTVLNRGCLKFQAGVFDDNNDTLAIELDFLPLWLAKITITPNMQKNQPEVANKLIEYQIKAKDVLAQAFIYDSSIKPIPQNYKQAVAALLDQLEENEKLYIEIEEARPKVELHDKMISADNNQTFNEVAKSLKMGRNKLLELLRQKEILMANNLPYQRYLNSGYFFVHEVYKNGRNFPQTLVTAKGLGYVGNIVRMHEKELQKQPLLCVKVADIV